MQEISKRINQTPLSLVLFFVLVFFLPFQERYHKFLRGLSQIAFEGQYLPSFFLSRSLDYYITDLLMIGILVVGLRGSIRSLFWEKSQKYLTLFLGGCLISIFFSSASGKIWPYYRWLQMALPAFVYFALCKKEGLLKGCFWILALTSIFQCLVTIDQYLVQESIGLKHLGEQRIAFNFSPEIQMASQERWIFDKWWGAKTLSKHILRPFGTFPHPNVLGAFLGIAFFATSFLYLKTKKRWLAPLLSLQLFTIALTYSRAAIFGVVGAFCGFLVLLWIMKAEWKKLLLPFLIGALFSGATLSEQYVQRGGVVSASASSHFSNSARVSYAKMALSMAKSRPLKGCGFGQYLSEVEPHAPQTFPFPILKVHNLFLLLLAEVGVVGVAAFLAFLGSLLYGTLKRGINLERATLLAILALILFSGCVDYFWLELQHGRLMLFVILALVYTQAFPHRQSPAR